MVLAVSCLVLLLASIGCGTGPDPGERSGGVESEEHGGGSESGEHGGDPESGERVDGSESGEEGEESGTRYEKGDTFDEVRAGARLVLSYESSANAFTGTVANTTEGTLNRVRVEVHLSNGIELGPTTPIDLAPSQISDITLPASSQPFDWWSAHPEVG